MFIHREGNKSKYAKEIIALFPPHKTYIEPFFGVGGIFFNKPLAKYNIVNDHSDFIYELWVTFKDKDKIDKLIDDIDNMLIYKKVFEYENTLASKILKISTSLYSNGTNTLKMYNTNCKKHIVENISRLKMDFYYRLKHTIIENKNAVDFLKSICSARNNTIFYYNDPPYCIGKGRLSDNKSWSIEKLEQLIKALDAKGNASYAISEHNHSKVLELFAKYKLNVSIVSRSKFSKSKYQYEILATNYKPNIQQELF